MRFVVKFAWVVLVVVLTWDPTLGARQSAREVPQVKRWWNKKKCSNDLPGDGHHYVNKWDGYFAFNCPKTGERVLYFSVIFFLLSLVGDYRNQSPVALGPSVD